MEKIVKEYLKHVFSEDEKRDLALALAESVNDLQRAEDEKKAVASNFKSRIDGCQANTNNLAGKLSSGYEFRNIDCKAKPDLDLKIWELFRIDIGELIRSWDMTPEDLEGNLFEDVQEEEGSTNETDFI